MGKKMPNYASLEVLLLLQGIPRGLTVQEIIQKQQVKRVPTVYQLVEKLVLQELVHVAVMDDSKDGRPLRRHALTARGEKCATAYRKLKKAFEEE
ncbi:hypothetical protein EXS62_02120 [Candidatus Kaiserbacteria bacterium]|nr:hypothetical protein [Candidatus Kaiserbacteria bacterium]